MKKQKKLSIEQKKLVKWLRVIIVLCIIAIVLELGYIGVRIYINSKSVVYVDTLNNYKQVDDGYIAVGNSDFKNSDFNDYQSEYRKAKFVKYNSDFEVEFESAYTKGYGSFFNDVVSYDEVQNAYERLTSGQDGAVKILVDPSK